MTGDQSPITLTRYALRRAGPQEALLTLTINLLIAALLFRRVDRLPLAGEFSVLTMVGPMCFILPALTTFFAVLRAVRARDSGLVAPPWPTDARWTGYAVGWGLVRGIAGAVVAVILLTAADRALDGQLLPRWACVLGIGLLASVLGYWLHATAILATARRFPA
jgi:hypothetical protein